MTSGEPEGQRHPALPSEVIALLRQLATGLGVHRLYDGGDVAAVGEAAERIAGAARDALAAGACEVVVAGQRFQGAPPGEHLARLAAALFERRVEHLRLEAIPTPDELSVLFAALSEDPATVEAAGGVQARLAAAGVAALRTSEDVPDPTSGQATPEELVAASEAAPTAEDRTAELAHALEMLPERDAEVLFDKLRQVAARLPEGAAARSPFYREVAVLAAALPPEQRPRFDRLLLEAAATDTFAERTLGHLTDVGLAELVARVARHEGVDPRALARQVAELGHRHANLPRLVLERGLARNQQEPTAHGGRDRVAAEYGDDLAAGYDELIATEPTSGEPVAVDELVRAAGAGVAPGPSAHPLALGFPDDEAAGRAIAATTLVDLLINRPREDHLVGLCAAIEEQLRVDVAQRRVVEVRQLLGAWHQAAALVEPAVARRLEEVVPRVVDVEVVVAALEAGAGLALALLQPFGASVVAPLVAALEPYRTPEVRRAARQVLSALAADHLAAVGEAVAPRSAAARQEVVAALEGVGEPGVVAVLGRIAQHRDADLQLRVLGALAGVDPSRAAPVIGGIVTRAKAREVQRRGLDVLAAGGVPASRDLLYRLADRRASPLPGGLRRRARKLAGG